MCACVRACVCGCVLLGCTVLSAPVVQACSVPACVHGVDTLFCIGRDGDPGSLINTWPELCNCCYCIRSCCVLSNSEQGFACSLAIHQ